MKFWNLDITQMLGSTHALRPSHEREMVERAKTANRGGGYYSAGFTFVDLCLS